MSTDDLARSWNALTPSRAREYLRTFGSPSESSKRLTSEVIAAVGPRRPRIVDFGCGNAQILEHFRAHGPACDYTGLDISAPLLEAAAERFVGDEGAHFVMADVNDPVDVAGPFDVALYSHVLEIVSSPERSLRAARRLAPITVIRFFEPPVADVDVTELREMEIGDGTTVPYLRRTFAADTYRLMLHRLGVTAVDVYRDESSADQVHVLRYR